MAEHDERMKLFEALPVGVIYHRRGRIRYQTVRADSLLPSGDDGRDLASRLVQSDGDRFLRQLDELLDGRRELAQIVAWPRFRRSGEAVVLSSRLADVDGERLILTTIEPWTAGLSAKLDGTLRALPGLVRRVADVLDEAAAVNRSRAERGKLIAADPALREVLEDFRSDASALSSLASVLGDYAKIGSDAPSPDFRHVAPEMLVAELRNVAATLDVQEEPADSRSLRALRIDRNMIQPILSQLAMAMRTVSTSGSLQVSWRENPDDEGRSTLRLSTDTLGLSDVSWHLPLLQVSSGPGGSAAVTLRVALGVDLAARWVTAIEGELSLFMRDERHACIDLTLPQAPAVPGGDVRAHRADRGEADAEPTILIVEDNAISRDLAVITARRRGYRVYSAVDGSDALNRMKDGPFDMILMDLQMPVMDGWEANREIRKQWPDQRVYAVSAMSSGEIEAAVLKEFDGFLEKPINWHTVAEILQHSPAPAT